MTTDAMQETLAATQRAHTLRRAYTRSIVGNGAIDPPRPQVTAWLQEERAALSAPSSEISVNASTGQTNAPISWPQLIGGWLSDVGLFLLAALPAIATYVGSDAPFTWRALISVTLFGIIAGLQVLMRVTGTDGLALRLRAMGQIKGGR